MSDFGAFVGGIGSIIILVMTALAFLAPIFLYLIQRNTHQTRQELRKTNTLLENLGQIIKNQNEMIIKNVAVKKMVADPPETNDNTVTMTCEHCGRSFKYSTNHSGKYKPCPGCQKKILLK